MLKRCEGLTAAATGAAWPKLQDETIRRRATARKRITTSQVE
jgi:hypothetical protein